MKLLLLCLGLTVACAHRHVVRSNFDAFKLSGKWYSVLLASDQKEKIEENGSMRVFVEDIDALENGSLAFKFHTMVNGECTENYLVADKVKDGTYTVEYDGQNEFDIIETEYDDYVIFHLFNKNDASPFQLFVLYGRTPDLSPKLKEKFVEICQENGVVKENILDLTKVDRCLYARDG